MSPVPEPGPVEVSSEAAKRELRSLRFVVMSAAHQLNNVLSGLLGYADLEREGTEDGSAAFAQTVACECERGITLSKALMNLAGRSYGRKQTVSPVAPLEDVLEALSRYLANNQVTVTRKWDALPTCTIDVGALRQAYLEVLLYATAPLTEGGAIEIHGSADGGFARLRIEARPTGDGSGTSARPPEWLDPSVIQEVAAGHGGTCAVDTSDDGRLRISLSLPLPPE